MLAWKWAWCRPRWQPKCATDENHKRSKTSDCKAREASNGSAYRVASRNWSRATAGSRQSNGPHRRKQRKCALTITSKPDFKCPWPAKETYDSARTEDTASQLKVSLPSYLSRTAIIKTHVFTSWTRWKRWPWSCWLVNSYPVTCSQDGDTIQNSSRKAIWISKTH